VTPTLPVAPVTDPDGDAVKYCFRIATGADANSGVVVESGCLATPTWTVPAGVLQDGVACTWQAITYSGATTITLTWVDHIKIDQRIGDHGPSQDPAATPGSTPPGCGCSTRQAAARRNRLLAPAAIPTPIEMRVEACRSTKLVTALGSHDHHCFVPGQQGWGASSSPG
jgi:hypothetical protein